MGSQFPAKSTMLDVAHLARVSIGTVSHVINGTAKISLATSARVNDAIRALHYSPSHTARLLRGKRSGIIGMLVPNLNNNFYTQISSTVIELAHESQYATVLLSYEYSLAKEKLAIQRIRQLEPDAMVVMNGYRDRRLLTELADSGVRLLVVDRHLDHLGIPCITFDNRRAIDELIAYLKGKGISRIGYFSETLELQNIGERYQAFCEAMTRHGLTIDRHTVCLSKEVRLNNLQNGYKVMQALLDKLLPDRLPETFICSSDLLAVAAMKAILGKGLSVPDDIGVAGFDDISLSSFVIPALTSIRQDCTLLGRNIWQQIKKMIDGEQADALTVLPQTLFIRDSC